MDCEGDVTGLHQERRKLMKAAVIAYEAALTRPPQIDDTVVGSYASAPKILLVEDNEMNRDMLSRRLERRG